MGVTAPRDSRLRLGLYAGAGIWLVLLAVGFVAPGGWTWGMAGPIGHIENFMIGLWLVALVIAPLLASRDPLRHTGVIQVFLLGLLAIALSSIRREELDLAGDALPIGAAIVSAGLVVWAHPNRSQLWRLLGGPATGFCRKERQLQ